MDSDRLLKFLQDQFNEIAELFKIVSERQDNFQTQLDVLKQAHELHMVQIAHLQGFVGIKPMEEAHDKPITQWEQPPELQHTGNRYPDRDNNGMEYPPVIPPGFIQQF